MANGNGTAKKIFTVIGNVIIWLFVAFAAIITVLTVAATSSEANVPTIAGKAILTVQTDSMKPTFNPGDIIIGQKLTLDDAKKLKVDDIITYEADLNDDNLYELNSHRIVKVVDKGNGNCSYITRGDNNLGDDQFEVAPNNVISKYTGTRIKGVGKVLGFLQTSKGFLICIVLPLVLFFVFELIKFVKKYTELKNADKAEITAEDEERIKQAAIEEYLKSQAAQTDNTVAEEKTEE